MTQETDAATQEVGVETEISSKEAPSSTQVDTEAQSPDSTQVENREQKPQDTLASRARPSDFVRMRKKMGSLEETLKNQNQTIQEMAALIKSLKSPEATETKFDKETFFTDPESILSAREKRLLSEIENIKKEIGTFRESQTVAERQRNEQEALEILFPKASPDSDESLEDRINSNQERMEKVMEILKTTGLDEFSKTNPKQAAKLVSKLLVEEKPAPNPTVLPKKLMGGNARGNMAGSKEQSNKDQKMSELKRMMEEIERSPELRFDEDHKKRRNQLIRDVERLAKE